MAIVKHGKTYWLDYRIGKKRYRKSLHTDEYYLALDKAKAILSEARHPQPAGLPVEQFGITYLEWARTKKPNSYRTEASQWAYIKEWLAGQRLTTLEQIRPLDVERLRAAILAHDRRTKGKNKRQASRSTANRYLALLRLMFNRAREWGLTTAENPVSKVKFFPEREKVRPLSESEIAKALELAQAMSQIKGGTPVQKSLYDIMMLVLNTGLRRHEALYLRWADVGDDSIMVKGKGNKSRSIPLNANSQFVLSRQAKVSQYVFNIPNRSAACLFRRTTETISRHLGIHFHLHLLRHAFASRLLAAGVDVVTISGLLGHSAYMTTLLYSHSSPARMRQAVGLLCGQGQSD